ncbi:MAG: hypothetical protein KAU22_00940, partial [Desulfuromonadales bacterium]|nr:hypothetical protein [Desulfuromonadales bacterium]
IERLLKTKIPQQVIAGYEPNLNIVAEPIKNGRSDRAGAKAKSPRNRNGSKPKSTRKFGAPRPKRDSQGNRTKTSSKRMAASS